MAGITSVRSTVVPAKRGWAIATALVGLVCLFGRAYGFGIVLLLAGIAWAVSLKDTHAVALSSASERFMLCSARMPGTLPGSCRP